MNSGIRVVFVKRVFTARLVQLGLILTMVAIGWGLLEVILIRPPYLVQIIILISASISLTAVAVKIWDINDDIKGE